MPRSTLLSFADPHALQASIRASDVDVVVAGSGAFRARLQQVDLHALWMQSSDTTVPVVAHTAIHRSRCAVFFASSAEQAPIVFSGTELGPGSAVVVAPGAEHYLRLPQDAGWCSMSLAPEDLAATAQAVVGRDPSHAQVTRHITLPHARIARLRRLHGRVTRLAATDPAGLAHPEVARAMEQALAHAFVECFAAFDAGPDPAPRASLSIMRRFREVIEAHPTEPLHVPDLCRALGVSSRSLARYSVEHLGVPAHRYLWLRRMQLARQALRQADPLASSVTRIAHDHGFGELGRFAVAYRALFGEHPSSTLRRPPDA